VRRRWPGILVSWSRVIAGTFKDPLVARDVLIGCVGGVVIMLLTLAGMFTGRATIGILPTFLTSTRPFLGPTHGVAELAYGLTNCVSYALLALFILLVVRLVDRHEWLAIAISGCLFALASRPVSTPGISFGVLAFIVAFAVLARAGLLAVITMAGWMDCSECSLSPGRHRRGIPVSVWWGLRLSRSSLSVSRRRPTPAPGRWQVWPRPRHSLNRP
jgi:hypothetical protein